MTRRAFLLDLTAACGGLAAAALWASRREAPAPQPSQCLPTGNLGGDAAAPPMPMGEVVVAPQPSPSPSAVEQPQLAGKVTH